MTLLHAGLRSMCALDLEHAARVRACGLRPMLVDSGTRSELQTQLPQLQAAIRTRLHPMCCRWDAMTKPIGGCPEGSKYYHALVGLPACQLDEAALVVFLLFIAKPAEF